MLIYVNFQQKLQPHYFTFSSRTNLMLNILKRDIQEIFLQANSIHCPLNVLRF
jgi:hypothetical protein